MTKLERLLKRVDELNDPKVGALETWRRASIELSNHVVKLWKLGRIDPSKIKLGD